MTKLYQYDSKQKNWHCWQFISAMR